MIITHYHDGLILNGIAFTIGQSVKVTRNSIFSGLTGRILEIRTDNDKETENEGIEICCEFDVPEDLKLIQELEETFSLLYQQPKTIYDIALDVVIMTPDELII